MDFTEYEKMCADLSKFETSKEFTKVKWMVTEKIHGANFSFHTNGDDVRPARRRDLLEAEENFFSFRDAEFMKTYPEKMKDVYTSVCKLLNGREVAQVSVYGELFGGKYIVDGKNLNISKTKPVQSEIQYAPSINWCAFDLSYRLKDQPDVHEYLDPEEAIKIFEEHDIFYLKPLFIGKMNDALNYELGFDSTLPKIFGLPALEKGTNKAEGIVAKPMKNLKGMRRGEEERVIVKIKLPEYLLVAQQVAEATPSKKTQGKPKQQNLLQKIMPYSTEQRLTSAISKIGEPSNTETENKIIKEFADDIFADIKDFDECLHKEWTNSKDQEKIRNIITKKASGLVKKYKNTR